MDETPVISSSSQQRDYSQDLEASKSKLHTPQSIRLTGYEHPHAWKAGRKWVCTIIVVMMTTTIASCSSIYTAAIEVIAHHYGCSRLISTLGVSTFLLGFATGSLLFAPLSEIWGRSTIFKLLQPLFLLCQIGCALAPNIGAMLAIRFLAGFFGAPAVTNSGGSLTDIWPQSQLSVPLALFSAAIFLGPVVAPLVGGFVTEYIHWQWNFWLVLMIGGLVYLAMFFYLPETYHPKLLRDKQYREGPTTERKDINLDLYVNLTRPWIMLFREPIVFTLSFYMALIYGILYLDFTAYPFVYIECRGWSSGIAGLSFLGIAVGMGIATASSPYINRVHSHYVRKLGGPQPEARLPHLIILSWLMPSGLFWFAWTASPPTHWISGILAGVPFGLGLVPLFLGITSYLTDCYGKYAASAITANAVLRSLFGATFPLFSRQLYEDLGTAWATSLLAFLAVSMAPLPWVFYHFGPRLRAVSQYHLQTMKAHEAANEEQWII